MTSRAKWATLVVLAIVILGAVGAGAWVYAAVPAYPANSADARRSDGQDFTQIERGRYLTIAADCVACHTAPGGAPSAGGRAIETSFGNVISSNITPDSGTGIGAWSDTDFDAALRLGRRRDHAFLYPAMPYVNYARMSRDDTQSIRAYLATVAPVRRKVVSDQLPFPFRVRAIMAVWDALFFRPDAFHPDPQKSSDWNRGAYLVHGAGHCAACHTPKNFLGGDDGARGMRGYRIQGWFASDITNDAGDGLADWTAPDIAAYLKTGHNRFAGATGPMADEIKVSSSQMTGADIKAIAIYLKDGSATEARPSVAAAPQADIKAGEAIYRDVCSACHALDGSGVAGLYPDLASSPSVRADDPQSLIRVVLQGARSVATDAEPTAPAMPAFAWQLSDAQIAAVLTYLRSHWNAKAPAVGSDRVHSERAGLATAAEVRRRRPSGAPNW